MHTILYVCVPSFSLNKNLFAFFFVPRLFISSVFGVLLYDTRCLPCCLFVVIKCLYETRVGLKSMSYKIQVILTPYRLTMCKQLKKN